MLIAFHKPFGVLSQFTSDGSPNRPLAEYGFPKNVYPIGRLDADSEGLLLLSDEARWNEKLLHPRHAHEREYWVQVEKIPAREALDRLQCGVIIQGRKTLPCRAWLLEPQPLSVPRVAPRPSSVAELRRVDESAVDLSREKSPAESVDKESAALSRGAATAMKIFPRTPPIRFRQSVPDCWIGLELIEGKNRQVRRMTAAIGHPTLRLLRVRIGNVRLADLPPGQWRILTAKECKQVSAF